MSIETQDRAVRNLPFVGTDRRPFTVYGGQAFAGISGGRTSAFMATQLSPNVRLSFQNTGREHEHTLEFLSELEGLLGRKITWLEYRPPLRKGAPPREATFAVVDFKTADRSGGPFESFMAATAEFRATKGMGPVSPWARSRICTAYMKHRVMRSWMISLGVESECVDWFVGLRADEPQRVHRLKERDTSTVTHRCPLFDAGITKQDVLDFWSLQSFDLRLRENQGNCTGCFLKDQSDISRLMGETETDPQWWVDIASRYPMFGGKAFPGYEQLASELPARLAIEAALRAGVLVPPSDSSMTPRRYLNVVRQEERRLRGETPAFSCACEQSYAIDEAEDAA